MSNHKHDFSIRAREMPSMVHYLAEHQQSINGPRTLAQTFTDYRRLLLSGAVKLVRYEHEQILSMNPDKVNWVDAYEWWKSSSETMS